MKKPARGYGREPLWRPRTARCHLVVHRSLPRWIRLTSGHSPSRSRSFSTWTPGTQARISNEYMANCSSNSKATSTTRLPLRTRPQRRCGGTFSRTSRTRSWSGKPPLAGRWRVSLGELQGIHAGTLFSGKAEACDGIVLVHDSLALTVMQFGVGLIGYRGDEGTWSCRLFRRDLSGAPADTYEQAMELVTAREPGADPHEQVIAELGRRGLATFAQRAVLAGRSRAEWRIGRGSPAPFELLTGSGSMRLGSRPSPSCASCC